MLKRYLDKKNELLKGIGSIKTTWLFGEDTVMYTTSEYRVIVKFSNKESCDSFIRSSKDVEGCLVAMSGDDDCSCYVYFIDFPECDSSYLKDFTYSEFYRAYMYEVDLK